MLKYFKIIQLTFVLLSFLTHKEALVAQENAEINIEEPSTLIWKGTYSTFRIGEKWFYEAQHHFRTASYEGTPFVGRMAQIYNRHAITYKFSDKFLATAGPVLRLNFTPRPGDDDYEYITLEPRFWHQYAFVDKDYFKGGRQYVIQHRLRFEHRWNRSNLKEGFEWRYRDRYRYRFTMKLPISGKSLQPKTWYATPLNVEIIMQSGKTVVNAPLEDLRIYPSVGYIFNTKVAYSVGMMYTLGQRLGAGENYRQRWILRANIWWTPDFRKWEKKVPTINLND